MRPTATFTFMLLLAGVVPSGCSLDGLVFDRVRDGAAGADPGSGGGGAGGVASGPSTSSGGAGGSSPPGSCENGFECVEVPTGWDGPVALYRGPVGGVQSCPAAYPEFGYQGSTGLGFDPAACAACACSAPGASCQGQGWRPYGDAACTQTIGYNYSGVTGASCGSVTAANVQAFVAHEVLVEVTGCVPSGGEPSLAPPVWSDAAVLCGGAALDACTDGSGLCAPSPEAPFQSGVCIWKAGDEICPGGFGEKHILGQEGDETDTRGCSACSCPQQFSCLSTYNFYAGSNCTQLIVSAPSDESCTLSPSVQSVGSYNVNWGSPPTGSCPPTGGAPEGAVTANNPVTVCCRP